MDPQFIISGLISYLGLVALLTFHEYGHAWMASKCGDETARLQGRCSLNPLVHIDPIGTVILPLLMLFLPSNMGRFMVGWAKPVPVNIANFRNPRLDDILVSMAGPWMNLLLAVALIGLGRLGIGINSGQMAGFCLQTARLSLLLCFFNLIPIPPLDGSHVVRSLIGMSYETYWRIARFGFIAVIVAINIPFVYNGLNHVTNEAWLIIGSWFGIG